MEKQYKLYTVSKVSTPSNARTARVSCKRMFELRYGVLIPAVELPRTNI